MLARLVIPRVPRPKVPNEPGERLLSWLSQDTSARRAVIGAFVAARHRGGQFPEPLRDYVAFMRGMRDEGRRFGEEFEDHLLKSPQVTAQLVEYAERHFPALKGREMRLERLGDRALTHANVEHDLALVFQGAKGGAQVVLVVEAKTGCQWLKGAEQRRRFLEGLADLAFKGPFRTEWIRRHGCARNFVLIFPVTNWLSPFPRDARIAAYELETFGMLVSSKTPGRTLEALEKARASEERNIAMGHLLATEDNVFQCH